jgi:transcriptional regulator with XRE-family HTH domain
MANIEERGERFSHLLGQEMKGAIVARGWTMRDVGEAIGTHPTTLSTYANGKRLLPSDVFSNACEVIGASPDELVERAYARLLDEMGPYRDDEEPSTPAAPAYPFRAEDVPEERKAAKKAPYDPRLEEDQPDPDPNGWGA